MLLCLFRNVEGYYWVWSGHINYNPLLKAKSGGITSMCVFICLHGNKISHESLNGLHWNFQKGIIGWSEYLLESIRFKMADLSQNKNGYNSANFTDNRLEFGMVVAESHSHVIQLMNHPRTHRILQEILMLFSSLEQNCSFTSQIWFSLKFHNESWRS